MARNPNSTYSITMIDASGEKSTVQFNARPYNVLTYADDLSDFTAFRTAVEGVTRGAIVADASTPFASKFGATVSDAQAARELKWLVRFQDDTTFGTGRLEIPTADLTAAPLVAGTDLADLADTQMAALVTAIEGAVRSVDGNTVTVLDVTLVGRNL